MRVLIAVSSRHGAAREIAEVIAGELRADNRKADVCEPENVDGVGAYDAVVIGSAVYMGHLMPEIERYVSANQVELQTKPVWVFCSGPIGDPPAPSETPGALIELAERLGAVGSRVFPGRIDTELLGFKERMVVKAVRARPGDYRPWDEICAWAAEIESALAVGVATEGNVGTLRESERGTGIDCQL